MDYTLFSADPALAAVVFSCLCLSVLVPLAATVICCSRSCRHRHQETHQETCQERDRAAYRRCRANCNVALLVITLCVIFCVAVLLVAAAVLIRSGLNRSGPAVGAALTEVHTVTSDVAARLTHLLGSDMETAVRDTERLMEGAAHRSTEQITMRLANQSRMTQVFKSLFQLDSSLQTVSAGLLALDSDLANLTAGWPGLVRRLGDLRSDLERAVSLCTDRDRHLCEGLQSDGLALTQLDVTADALAPSLELVRRYRSADVAALAETAQTSVTALANSLQSGISTARPGIVRELRGSLERAGRHLAEVQPALRQLLAHLSGLAERTRRRPLVTETAATAIWGSTLAVPCLVLTVTALLYGAVVGSYFPSRSSSRPHRHTANTIRMALFLLTVTSALVWLVAAVGALVAGLLQAGLCPRPADDRPAEVAQVTHRMGLRAALLPATPGPVQQSLADTLRQCRAGGSLLTVFNLDRPAAVNAAGQLDAPRLHSLLDRVVSRAPADGRTDLLATSLNQYLRLAAELVHTDLGPVKEKLERRSASSDVAGVLTRLSSALSQLSSETDRDRLSALADRLTEIVTGALYTLQKQKARLVVQVATLDMSAMALRGQVTSLRGQIAQVDSFLSNNASHVIQQEESNFRRQIRGRLEQFSNHVQTVLRRDTSCLPVWLAFRSSASTACHQLLGGVGAYWLGCALTGALLLLLAAAAGPLLARLTSGRRPSSEEPSVEGDFKLWGSVSSEMQQTNVKTVGSATASEPTDSNSGEGRW
ncbi:uncharacterized protein LOC122365227 [Amphibalanus amphitrite]|uniref:uncharacterized protein LOC122365227 n=1 Tax=Amphibalanus amphitrite TaxID=1232801 RepID=UPI001C924983|nr:uncharacterized protein LOC122365227 [Amphibalanus amphitrite]